MRPVFLAGCGKEAGMDEQNVTSEKFEDFDGERWIIPDD